MDSKLKEESNMKREYQELKIEITVFDRVDIITSSCEGNDVNWNDTCWTEA